MKGFTTQSACVLLERPVTLDELAAALQGFDVVRRIEGQDGGWMAVAPSLLIAMRPEVNGYISADIVNRSWPDGMGDPKGDSELFGAWTFGFFGPFTFPGNLQRATEQCWVWADGKTVAARHKGFIRLRSSYAFGAQDQQPILPKDYDPVPELLLVTEIARATLRIKGALCYFNPNGESLRGTEFVDEVLKRHAQGGPLPLDLWCNVRLFNLADADGWCLMDTVGMEQLDLREQEACFLGARYEAGQLPGFFYNVAGYILTNGPVIKDRDTINGPAGVNWQGRHFAQTLVPPPRGQVLRWLPVDGSRPPRKLLEEADATT
jgi:hypothetical protein